MRSVLQSDLVNNFRQASDELDVLLQKNEKLQQENNQLKKSLLNEQLLHNNLYKQWKELKQKKQEQKQYERPQRWKLSKPVLIPAIILVTLLFTWALYNLFFKQATNTSVISDISSPSVTTAQRTEEERSTAASTVTEENVSFNSKRKDINATNKTVTTEPALRKENTTQLAEHGNTVPQNSTVNSVIYKVRSKAYFYNEPDSNTRRNAFINHWNNSYANLKPLDDKKGFVYVVFTNHIGQTSKGWLRKSDLFPVDKKFEE